MQTIIIITIVLVATAYIGWSLWRRVTGRDGCGCGCDAGSADCADKSLDCSGGQCPVDDSHHKQERE